MRVLYLILLLLLQTGCTSYLVVSGGEVKQDKVQEIKHGLAEMRGLDFTSEVPIEVKSKAAIKKYLEASLIRDYGEEKLKNISIAYGKLGLLPEGLDLKEALLNFYADQVVAFYDPKAKKLFLPAEWVGGMAINAVQFLAQRDIMGEMVLAHELTHALQEQHFSIGEKLDILGNDDKTLALRCVVEGDALLAGFGYLFGFLDEENIAQVNDSVVGNIDETRSTLSDEIPVAIMEQLLFQYYGGVSFVSRYLNERGWLGINRIYSDPPLSTEQVLHPEKYIDNPDPPTRISLGALSLLFPAGWTEIEDNVLGEFMIRVLFTEFFSKKKGISVAEGWDGDRFIAFRDGDKTSFIWAAVWDSVDDAEEFTDNYQKLLSIKYRSSEPNNAHSYIEQRGLQTIVVEGLENHHTRKYIDRIWQEMKLEEAPFKPPFPPIPTRPALPL